MKKLFAVAVIALLLPASGMAQAQREMKQQRQQLQAMIIQRFMDHVSNELQLDGPTRGRLEQQLRQSGQQRRELARSTADLRNRMMRATRDSSANDAEFRKMLGEMTALRQREEDLWKSDQDELGKILTPRQHARFIFMWLRFNEQVRDAALRPPPRPF